MPPKTNTNVIIHLQNLAFFFETHGLKDYINLLFYMNNCIEIQSLGGFLSLAARYASDERHTTYKKKIVAHTHTRIQLHARCFYETTIRHKEVLSCSLNFLFVYYTRIK
jgi:hypothetical protein